MCSFKFFNQNVCTVNVHEMYYKFNPGLSPSAYCLPISQWEAQLYLLLILLFQNQADTSPTDWQIFTEYGKEVTKQVGNPYW
jgi:hypothetical protein